MLMSTNDRFQRYTMKIIGSEIVFYRQGEDETDSSAIRQDLMKVKVHSPDTPEKKCTNKLHFCLWVTALNGHRKLYFVKYEEMHNAAMYVLEAQGFSSRAE